MNGERSRRCNIILRVSSRHCGRIIVLRDWQSKTVKIAPSVATLGATVTGVGLNALSDDGSVARPDEGIFLKGTRPWHTESSFKKVGTKAPLPRALEVPDCGGNTEWADGWAACDALDDATHA